MKKKLNDLVTSLNFVMDTLNSSAANDIIKELRLLSDSAKDEEKTTIDCAVSLALQRDEKDGFSSTVRIYTFYEVSSKEEALGMAVVECFNEMPRWKIMSKAILEIRRPESDDIAVKEKILNWLLVKANDERIDELRGEAFKEAIDFIKGL